jgi:hypothetical protein
VEVKIEEITPGNIVVITRTNTTKIPQPTNKVEKLLFFKMGNLVVIS